MKLVYIGRFDEVAVEDISGFTALVKNGESFDVPDELADKLLEQAENYKKADAPAPVASTVEVSN